MTFKQRFSSRWTSVLLVISVLWMVSQAAGMWVRVRRLTDEADRMEDRVAELERDITRRKAVLGLLGDPAWLEYQARLLLNYKMPDEQAVVVYKKEKSDIIGAVASTSAHEESATLYRRLRAWIAGVVQW